jgi:lipopolysaccharide transport system permease protein
MHPLWGVVRDYSLQRAGYHRRPRALPKGGESTVDRPLHANATTSPVGPNRGDFVTMLTRGWRHRMLIATLVQRDIVSRYRGSALGLLWTFITPLLMLGIYTFVFTEIFGMRWGGSGASKDFALMLFAGMLIFSFFAESVSRAPTLILNSPNLVKKIVFPLEIQAWVVIGSTLFQLMVNLLVLLGAFVVAKGLPPVTTALLPVLVVPLCLLCLGLVWYLSALGVFLRDIGQVVGLAVTATMFLSPLFYPVSSIPERFKPFFYLNPLTFLIDETRKILIAGTAPDWPNLAIFTLVMTLFSWTGFWFFQRTRAGFADVI